MAKQLKAIKSSQANMKTESGQTGPPEYEFSVLTHFIRFIYGPINPLIDHIDMDGNNASTYSNFDMIMILHMNFKI